MSLQHDNFIAAFKRVEQLVRNYPGAPEGANFKWLEDKMTDQKIQSKMRMCRMIRNYVQHEEDYNEFIGIADGMISFLNNLYAQLSKTTGVYGSIMSSVDSINEQDTLTSAAKLLKQGHESVMVVSNDGVFRGWVTSEFFLQRAASGYAGGIISTSLHLLDRENTVFVKSDDVVPKDKPKGKIVVTTTGNCYGVVKGVVY